MKPQRQWLLVIWLLLGSVLAAEAQYCVVCGKGPLTRGTVWVYKIEGVTNLVCADCHDLPLKCSVCSLPVKEGYTKTTDGRIICRRDASNVVLTQEEAQQIFEEARQSVRDVCGADILLQSPAVSVRLFDVDYWDAIAGERGDNPLHKIGFSSSRRAADGSGFTHTVILLSGRRKSEEATTCAHEYMHLWINENLPPRRILEPNTREGLCELVAYKLAVLRGDTLGQQHLRENPYTNGKILTLVDLEARVGMWPILNWIKSGNEMALTEESFGNVAPARPAAPATPLVATLPRVVRSTPERLVLKGILRSGGKRTAIINNVPFSPGEESEMRVGDKILQVHCLEVQSDAVVISVDGAPTPTTLRLE